MGIRKKLKEKLKEALQAVLPIIGLVLLLSFTIAPISPSILLCFLIGGILLIAGIVFFTLGAELAMSPMGERVGTAMTQSKKLWVVVALSFLLGFIITISEPDLQVLAQQVPAVPNLTLILAVACGVGVFLVVALLRMLFSIALPPLLVCFYAVIFILAFFVPKEFLSVAFDSGGVTTGPMTVPFIMALGVGISATRSDRHAADDSFGLVALCSIGPILAVMMLGLIYNPDSAAYMPPVIPEIADSKQLWNLFAVELPTYMKEIALSLLPIVLFFAVFQALILKLSGRNLTRILIGLVYTYIGLVLFLTGVNVGFMPAGNYLGQVLAGLSHPWVIVPIAMVMGYFIVKAEPAVYVLNKQVEEITDGAISARPTNSGISPNFTRSCGVTSAYSSPALRSTLEEICALKPMLFLSSLDSTIRSMPSKAPPQMNKMFVVSIGISSCCGCFRPPWGGTLATVPSMIFSSACCTPSPETSRVIDTFSLFFVILSISSRYTIPSCARSIS